MEKTVSAVEIVGIERRSGPNPLSYKHLGRAGPARSAITPYPTSTYEHKKKLQALCVVLDRCYNTSMNENEQNENEQCVECGETEVYLIDGEICQNCDEDLYDDAF